MKHRSILAAAAAAALIVAAPMSASAHSSATPDPADGATVTTLPSEFSVTASDPFFTAAGDGGFGLLVQDAAGLYYGDGCVTIDSADMSIPATLGAPGTYTITWQFISADSHPTSGTSTFEWAPSAPTEEAVGSTEAPVCGADGGSAAPGADDEQTAAPTADSDVANSGSDAADSGALPWVIGGIVVVLLAAGISYRVVRRRAAND
ncbi:copper resistance CopC family protein [Diaminobutyricimonas sp. TR449]|uniref:copper resistance CopC family protein n=1 Tax=Diaminobutyricimonas sp. TR449 TaxID=2708076 RepID=UPI001422B5CA|nr:copper resistance CopC family protein [Diaminobutyricimonas sp. TR449]